MDNASLDLVLGTVAKGGVGAVIIATLYGLSLLVTAWRGGSVEQKRQAQQTQEIAELRTELGEVKKELHELRESLYGMRYQRDEARVRVRALEEKHGEPVTVWPPDPPVGGTPL